MKIYLDVCCLNRPFDDQAQDRIHLESEAVITILKHVEAGDWEWIGSSVILYEIARTPNTERKRRVLKLCEKVSRIVVLDEEIHLLAKQYKNAGLSSYDALHLACANKSQVDVFLSTDDKLIKLAHRRSDLVKLKVMNPLNWLQEALDTL
jgi:predicted nucleic acid-binding protein